MIKPRSKLVAYTTMLIFLLGACAPAVLPDSPDRIEGEPTSSRPTAVAATAEMATEIPETEPMTEESDTPTPENSAEPTLPAIDQAEANRALLAAAETGDVERVKELLAQGADVHTANAADVTPLIAAAYRNNLEVARALIEAGADVNVQDNTQQSAYLISTSDGYLELLRLTLAAGADVHSKDSYNGTGLIRAADRGHVEIIAELLKTDIEIDHVNRLGWTALLEAIILGDGGPRHTEVVRLLVEAGADVNLADGSGVTPMEHARRQGYGEMLSILEAANRP